MTAEQLAQVIFPLKLSVLFGCAVVAPRRTDRPHSQSYQCRDRRGPTEDAFIMLISPLYAPTRLMFGVLPERGTVAATAANPNNPPECGQPSTQLGGWPRSGPPVRSVACMI